MHITVGEVFTTARVGDKTVAIGWGQPGDPNYYVSAGRGTAQEFVSQAAASAWLLQVAMNQAGGGAATVTRSGE